MNKYPQIVIDNTNIIINELKSINFFTENEIEDLTFANQHLLNFFQERYVDYILKDNDIYDITNDEFNTLLTEIIIGTHLYELKEKGVIDSIKDENENDVFFLTEKGKKIAKDI